MHEFICCLLVFLENISPLKCINRIISALCYERITSLLRHNATGRCIVTSINKPDSTLHTLVDINAKVKYGNSHGLRQCDNDRFLLTLSRKHVNKLLQIVFVVWENWNHCPLFQIEESFSKNCLIFKNNLLLLGFCAQCPTDLFDT